MPFKSQAQRGYMYANHPEMAKEFEAATPKGAKLPQHVKKKKPMVMKKKSTVNADLPPKKKPMAKPGPRILDAMGYGDM